MSNTDVKLLAVVAGWRARAREFMREAEASGNVRDIYRLVGMAASLYLAAREVCTAAALEPNEGSPVANAEADRVREESEIHLARGAEKSRP